MEQAGIVIAGIIYLIPIATLIWKAATLSSRVNQNEKDIKEVKQLQAENNKAVLDALNKLNDTMEKVRLDVEILKITSSYKKEVKHEQVQQ